MVGGARSSFHPLSHSAAPAQRLQHEKGQEEQEAAQVHVVNPKSITIGRLYGQVGTGKGQAALTVAVCASWPGS